MLELIFLLWSLLCPDPATPSSGGSGRPTIVTLDTGGETGHVPPKPPPPPPSGP